MSKRFQRVYIEVSNVCNLQCSFCPPVLRDKKLISLDLFEKVVAQVAPLTEQVAFHLMGDPLLHPHLEELVSRCENHGVRVFLVTNGVLLRERQMQLLLRPVFHQVNFSLHSFSDNFPGRDPGEYLEKIFNFTALALAERPELYLNYRLWNLDGPRGQTEGNQDFLRRIQRRFGGEMPGQVDVRHKKSFRIKGRLYFHFDTEFVWPSLDLPVLGERGTCHGLSAHIGILADGTVVPCCLDKEGSIPLGNVIERDLLEILDGPRARAMHRGFRDGKLIENLCRRCQYIERFQPRRINPERGARISNIATQAPRVEMDDRTPVPTLA